MGTVYSTSFTPYLELFEPRSVYVSELRLQHAWKNSLWKQIRYDSIGRTVRILSPGRHNHSDGPDFLDASIMLDEKLLHGDIELHHRASDWYAHKHHIDPAYNRCILHIIFNPPGSSGDVHCEDGRYLPTCHISLEEILNIEPPGACRIFTPDKEAYFNLLQKQGWERVNKKIRYFYDNRLRFPGDIMLYWGLFKACGYRYNEENMIKLFIRFPWAAYCDELLDRQDIIPTLNELAGFSIRRADINDIRWTRSRTRPAHFPERRVAWLGKLMTMYYRSSLADILYESCYQKKTINNLYVMLFKLHDVNSPGATIQKEMLMNTVLTIMAAMRREKGDKEPIYSTIRKEIENCTIPQAYGTVKRFHNQHGISQKDKRQRNWLLSQGVLNIRDLYCSQGLQLSCPVCLMDDVTSKDWE